MMTLPPSVKIYVAAQPVDARKSFDGLVALVEAVFGLEPLSGHVFGFINRRGNRVTLCALSFTCLAVVAFFYLGNCGGCLVCAP
jgi:transposase